MHFYHSIYYNVLLTLSRFVSIHSTLYLDKSAITSFILYYFILIQVYLHRIVMTGQKSNEEDVKMMTKAMTQVPEFILNNSLSQCIFLPFVSSSLIVFFCQGWWLLLEDIHNNTQLLSKLLVWTKKQKADSSFRLWLSADINNNTNLIRTFHSCSPIVIDAPKLVGCRFMFPCFFM